MFSRFQNAPLYLSKERNKLYLPWVNLWNTKKYVLRVHFQKYYPTLLYTELYSQDLWISSSFLFWIQGTKNRSQLQLELEVTVTDMLHCFSLNTFFYNELFYFHFCMSKSKFRICGSRLSKCIKWLDHEPSHI